MRVPWEYEEPKCAEIGGDFWFPEKGEDTSEYTLAKSICHSCTHKAECLEWGINNELHGVWGGMSARERQMIRGRRKRQSA